MPPYHNESMYCNYVLYIGCPRVVRADHGTENCLVAKVHIGFRMHHSDDLAGVKSFIYGPSTANTVSNTNAQCMMSL